MNKDDRYYPVVVNQVGEPTLALAGCSESSDGNGGDSGTSPHHCAPGLKPMGPACVPIFDECQDDEVPMLGGGCKRVGVRECLDGWGLAGPPDWKCKPIGPPRTCLKGWEKVAGGWCEPILPMTKCPAGTMEKIGYRTCQPIGDCGTGTWGNITAANIYVDQGHAGTGGKGTKTEPYMTIGEALKQATAGDHIAVAAGTYVEQVSIRRKVTLEGRCAQMVTIKMGLAKPAVEIKDWANGALLRGVTITGVGVGLSMSGINATVERSVIQGCEDAGIVIESGSTMSLWDSLVAGNRVAGIGVVGSRATVERTVVRDMREQVSDKQFGIGIEVSVLSGKSLGSELVIRDSVVTDNLNAGITVYSSKATVERTVVRHTRERASDREFGTGIYISNGSRSNTPSELMVRDSLVAGNRSSGISLWSSKATIERSIIRDTRETASDKIAGRGITLTVNPAQGSLSEVSLDTSLVIGNRDCGIVLFSSMATVKRTVVRDTRKQASDDEGGMGICAQVKPGLTQPSELIVHDSLVKRNRTAGIVLKDSKANIERTVIRDTREQASDYELGRGIWVTVGSGQSQPSELVVRDSLVAWNREAGVILFSSSATLERTVVRDTREQASDNRLGEGIAADVHHDSNYLPKLTVHDSLVTRNRAAGILLESTNATIERTAVQDTRVSASDNMFGTGIQAGVSRGLSMPSDLTIHDSWIVGNRNVGILLDESSAKIVRSAITNTQDDNNNLYGDGIVADNLATTKSTFVVEDVLVGDCTRAGFLFISSGGSVHRSLIRKNVFSIDLEGGSDPVIGDDNMMVENQVNRVTMGLGLKAPPIPSVPNL